MIFSPALAEKAMSGAKTVTRRPVKFRKYIGSELQSPPHPIQPCMYRIGRTYAVQPGRGQKAIGRIRILDVRGPEPVGHAWGREGWTEAKREGFRGPGDFADYWIKLYPKEDGSTLVWRIEFERVSSDPKESDG